MISLRERLGHVYWIGGGSGGGKSTVARRLAAAHGLRLYLTDDVMGEHTARTTASDSPMLAQFMAMDMDERWLNRSPETMLETFHWYRGEGFGLIIEDLLGMAGGPGVIAEGFRLLPELVAPLATPGHAVWLLPTAGFRVAAFESRGSMWKIAGKTSDPAAALDNLLKRDGMFTERVGLETCRLGLPAMTVDTSMSEEDLLSRVTKLFGL